MSLSEAEKSDYADRLYEAYESKEPIEPITEEKDELTTEEAYEIQGMVVDQLRETGTPQIGHKLGLVSEAKQEQLGIPEPIFSPIFDRNRLNGEPIPSSEMINPRLEAEVGFVLDSDLEPPVTPSDVMAATRAVVPVAEVIESRFKGWSIPTAQDVIADNCSTAKLAVGETVRDVRELDLVHEGVTVSVDGEIEETGVGGDIMGHPARSVAWLGNRLADRDEQLTAGELVMSGGISAAIDTEPGEVYTVSFGNLGSIELRAE